MANSESFLFFSIYFASQDINSFIDAFSQNALKIMEACHTYVYVYSVSKKDEPWIVTSQRHKSLQSTSVQIKASLQSGDIARLSEGLSKLEQLLKQGTVIPQNASTVLHVCLQIEI